MEPWCWTVRDNSKTPQLIMSKNMNRQATEFWWWSDQAVVMIGLSQISHTNKQKRKWSTFVRPLLAHDSSSVGFVGSLFNFSSVQPGSWSSFTFMCLNLVEILCTIGDVLQSTWTRGSDTRRNNAPCISHAWIIILLRFFAVLFSEGLLWYWICYVHSG